ncbi:MAG: flagellar hook protein FlgE [Rhodoferax sp.]|nr:flagellar hook protein FlgE [Rhodoferax sp.]
MSFQTGLSGLNASAKNLDVIGNNIANSNTVGAKASRTEFSAVVAASIGASGGGGGGGGGIGVEVSTISQQFSQGTINITGNNLDCAINGGGFFELTLKDGSSAYTRDGQFKLDSNGNMITNSGASVMGFLPDATGTSYSATPSPLVIPTGAPIAAKATSAITAQFNLDARAPIAASAVPPTPYSTYGTTMNGFDAQGVAVPVKMYFIKTAADAWDVYDGDPAGVPTPGNNLGSLTFDTAGNILTPVAPLSINLTSTNPNIGTFVATLDVSKATQYGTSFAISDLSQDGYTAGTLTGVSISEQGIITTRYSNGQTQATGKLALADFRNVQGLKPVGQGNWVETNTSGQPIHGAPGQGNFGTINSGSLEASNIDLTAELVAMMTAQRDYQANAQTIKTQDTVLQTLVNLR